MQAQPNTLKDLIGIFLNLVSIIIPIIVSMSFLVFLWGLVKFIAKTSDKDIKDGKNLMIWGTVALFVLVSAWGIVRFFSGEFGFGRNIFIPLLPE